MENYDSNMIKPVDGLQSIIALTPAKRREQRRRKQEMESKKKEHKQKQPDEESRKNEPEQISYIDDAGDSKIDYCA